MGPSHARVALHGGALARPLPVARLARGWLKLRVHTSVHTRSAQLSGCSGRRHWYFRRRVVEHVHQEPSVHRHELRREHLANRQASMKHRCNGKAGRTLISSCETMPPIVAAVGWISAPPTRHISAT